MNSSGKNRNTGHLISKLTTVMEETLALEWYTDVTFVEPNLSSIIYKNECVNSSTL